MSLFSRLFRKAPPPPVVEKPLEESDLSGAEPSSVDRAALAAMEEEALRTAIEGRDTESILKLVIEGSSTKVRQLAAQAVEDPAQLRRLLKDVRGGNDKNVYKILKHKRDALLAHERQAAQTQADIGAALAAIERHSHRPYDPLFTPTLEQFELRWNALAADAPPEIQQKAQQSIGRCREVIAQHLQKVAAEAARELAATNAAAEAQRQRDLQNEAAAAAAAEAAAILEAEKKAQAEKLAAEALALRQLGGLINKALGALKDGSTGRAAGLRRAIEEKLPTVPSMPAYLSKQLQQLDGKLSELKDWKDYAAAPKRTELIEEMESLVGSTMDPTKLAEQIKTLQEEWRTISKGAGENVEAEWQRFHEAAQKAYQPCREYFETQAKIRQDNLEKRKALFERLAAFEAGHNWEQPDWRTVVTALRESRQEWRQHFPVDRAAGKDMQDSFDALTLKLQTRVDEEHARNVRQKKSLTARAQRLLAVQDSRKAIDELKALQLKWKAVGPVPHDQDRALWEEFRTQCDAVFQRRKDEQARESAEMAAKKAEEAALRKDLKEAEKLYGITSSDVGKFSQLGKALEALKESPNKDA